MGMSRSEIIISIVIPAYNYAKTLPRAVGSVVRQLDERVELLVIDDGSTDETPEVLNYLHQKYPGQFRSFRQINAGLAAVRNRGIDEAKGQYLVFLDADDELVEGIILHLLNFIFENSQSQLIIAGHISVKENGKESLHLPGSIPSDPKARVRGYLLDKTLAVSNGACVMRKDVFDLGRYPEDFRNAEDIPVFASIFANFNCVVVKLPMARIYKHSDSLRHNLNYDLQVGERLVDEVFDKSRIPESMQDLKKEFLAQRYLSLFRNFLLSGDKENAKRFYCSAVKTDRRALLRFSYARKAIRLWLS